jgi:ATP-dependent DNA helicase RecQ
MSLNPQDEEIILTLLRTYPGIYEMKVAFNSQLIAKKANVDEKQVLSLLQKLKEKEVIDYSAKNNDASITFNEVREDDKTINRVAKYLEAQNNLKKNQLESVLHYIKETTTCKNKLLLRYFGETVNDNCGICSYCISKSNSKKDSTILSEKIIGLLKIQELNSRDIQKLTKFPKDDVIFALQNLLENDSIIVKSNNLYTIKK